MWIIGVFVAPQAGKVGVGVTVEGQFVTWLKDEALFKGAFEVAADTDERYFMFTSGCEGVASALV